MNQKVFREESLARISEPEQLNDYIKVTSPSVWVVLGAVLVLLAAIVVWSFTGSLPTKVDTAGIAESGQLTCYLSQENAAKIRVGMEVRLSTGETGTVSAVEHTPLSEEEAAASVSGDYAVDALGLSQWNVPVTVQTDSQLEDGRVYPLSVVTDSIHPIEFLLDSQGDQA